MRLGASHLVVSYPDLLDGWFNGLSDALDQPHSDRLPAVPTSWVRISAHPDGRFDISATGASTACGLDLGQTLATFWERATFLLLDGVRDALALHAAAVHHGSGIVLLPGRTGSGKTRLSLWYRTRGFELLTDEVLAIANTAANGVAHAALPRPIILKSKPVPETMLRPGERALEEQDTPAGFMLRLHGRAGAVPQQSARGLIVFPQFTPGAPFWLEPLTAAQAGLRLLENCLNSRNLEAGGMLLASFLARQLPAVALAYGDTEQLAQRLDVFTRAALAVTGAEDVSALCAAFTAAPEKAAAPLIVFPPTAASRAPAQTRSAPAPTVARYPRRLTIGMATYDDYDGVYFTIQSLRLNNPAIAGHIEFVVVDNNPGGLCSEPLSDLGKWIDGYRYIPRGDWSGTAIRNVVFEEANSPFVLCVDAHVLLVPDAVTSLLAYCEANPESRDLIQGPLIYDDLRRLSTHMEPQWRDGMFGIWASDPRGEDTASSAFEIPMHGLGLFACRRTAWPGFHPEFRGFGGEEGYIHEKIRQRGGRTLCLPSLRWMHRFGRPQGPPYVNRWEDRIRNYLIGLEELELDTAAMENHFIELLGAEVANRIITDVKRGVPRA